MAAKTPPTSSADERPIELPIWTRGLGTVAAVLLVVAGLAVSYSPRSSVTVKKDAQGETTETTTSSPTDSTLAIAIYGTGVALLFFALNGLRLTKLSVGNFSGESAEVSNALEKAKEPTKKDFQALSAGGAQAITDDDVISAFSRISQEWPEDIDLPSMAPEIKAYLLTNGVATKQQLDEMVSSKAILNSLRSLYIRVLRRPRDKPLDPIAVAAWGPILYRLGVTNDVIRAIEDALRKSPEYHDRVAVRAVQLT